MNAAGAFDTDSGPRVERTRFGIWLFLASEAMFFAGLLSAFVALKDGSPRFGSADGHLAVGQAAIATVLLVLSSFTMSRAIAAIRRGDSRSLLRFLAVTLALGLAFLAVQTSEFVALGHAGLTPRTNLYWSSFFVLTSVHALHVTAGLVWIAVVSIGARGLRFTREDHVSIVNVGLYWHFVDAVWIVLFTLLYLT
jgi:heme/copper-type cytochrome/quinol oxidase subunit 3